MSQHSLMVHPAGSAAPLWSCRHRRRHTGGARTAPRHAATRRRSCMSARASLVTPRLPAGRCGRRRAARTSASALPPRHIPRRPRAAAGRSRCRPPRTAARPAPRRRSWSARAVGWGRASVRDRRTAQQEHSRHERREHAHSLHAHCPRMLAALAPAVRAPAVLSSSQARTHHHRAPARTCMLARLAQRPSRGSYASKLPRRRRASPRPPSTSSLRRRGRARCRREPPTLSAAGGAS